MRLQWCIYESKYFVRLTKHVHRMHAVKFYLFSVELAHSGNSILALNPGFPLLILSSSLETEYYNHVSTAAEHTIFSFSMFCGLLSYVQLYGILHDLLIVIQLMHVSVVTKCVLFQWEALGNPPPRKKILATIYKRI